MILRNIIRAHGKNINAVHTGSKTLTPLVLRAVHRNRAKSDFSRPGIQNLPASIKQLHRYRIQMLFSVAVRPPEHWICNDDIFHFAFVQASRFTHRFLSVRCHNSHARGKSLCNRLTTVCQSYHRLNLKSYLSVFMILQYLNRIKMRRLYSKQGNRPPDTCIRQMSPPVPAKHAMCLANMYEPVHCILCSAGRCLLIRLGNISDWRKECNG